MLDLTGVYIDLTKLLLCWPRKHKGLVPLLLLALSVLCLLFWLLFLVQGNSTSKLHTAARLTAPDFQSPVMRVKDGTVTEKSTHNDPTVVTWCLSSAEATRLIIRDGRAPFTSAQT